MRLAWSGVVAASLLAGCALFKGPQMSQTPSESLWQERRAALERIDRFALQARVASNGSLGMKGDLRWQQNPDGSFDLRVAGPFGVGALSIVGTPSLVEVRSREGSQVTNEPEAWLRRKLGWTFPIAGLRYWALGLPAPGSPAVIELDAEGEIAALEQDGWRLEYDEYQPAGPVSLPRRLQLAKPEVTIKLVADRWDGLPGVDTAQPATEPPLQ
ncbi:outer membrane lipoprotein LolB [Solimonas sp. K1W22B-7]|uniref:lipoprotein insertase outer membrane protein LolB n=1 Tax=Solimonas sp. K1W22B-7 TaxID=2303331 RepID=UPI000E330DB7|nr:lipoprotein insertase outer membrane protein LolB [Solimonas sp. K1W22B-7]AXQ28601.1 outer membrane lipoprotein LolB [Solimonas sp. K1W22B-7]